VRLFIEIFTQDKKENAVAHLALQVAEDEEELFGLELLLGRPLPSLLFYTIVLGTFHQKKQRTGMGGTVNL